MTTVAFAFAATLAYVLTVCYYAKPVNTENITNNHNQLMIGILAIGCAGVIIMQGFRVSWCFALTWCLMIYIIAQSTDALWKTQENTEKKDWTRYLVLPTFLGCLALFYLACAAKEITPTRTPASNLWSPGMQGNSKAQQAWFGAKYF